MRGDSDSLISKYYIETKLSLQNVAEMLAEIETTGKWGGIGEMTSLFRQCRGSVAEVEEIEAGKGYITLSLPMMNFNMEDSAFTSLWLYMIGGATHAMIDYEKSRLIDFWFPEAYNKYFYELCK